MAAKAKKKSAATKKKSKATAQRLLKTVYVGGEPSEKPVFYTNGLEISTSLFDVQIRINHTFRTEGQTMLANNLGTLVMSPQHAKAFAKNLTGAIAKYEETFGPLPRVSSEPE